MEEYSETEEVEKTPEEIEEEAKSSGKPAEEISKTKS